MAKKLRIAYQSPVGRLDYNHLITPDTKFGPPVYHTTLSFDAAEGKRVLEDLESKHPSFKGLIPYTIKDDGSYSFKIKQRRYIQWFNKDGQKQEKELLPTLLNSDNTVYTGSEPWGGTTGEVAFYLEPTKGPKGESIALRLKGVRFHDVVLGGASTGDPLFGPSDAQGVAQEPDPLQDEFDDDIPF